MNVTAAEAAQNLDAILQRAEEGDEVVITRNGRASIRLVREEHSAVDATMQKSWRDMTREERRAVLDEIRGLGNTPNDDALATANHDFLYDENGLPA